MGLPSRIPVYLTVRCRSAGLGQELFMKQMLVDLKEVVAEDPDFDPKRFPCTAQRVLE